MNNKKMNFIKMTSIITAFLSAPLSNASPEIYAFKQIKCDGMRLINGTPQYMEIYIRSQTGTIVDILGQTSNYQLGWAIKFGSTSQLARFTSDDSIEIKRHHFDILTPPLQYEIKNGQTFITRFDQYKRTYLIQLKHVSTSAGKESLVGEYFPDTYRGDSPEHYQLSCVADL